MIKVLKLHIVICCLLIGTYAIAKPGVLEYHEHVISVAKAKEVKDGTDVELAGKLIMIDKKYALQDSTGAINLVFRYESDEPHEDIGKKVTVTGDVEIDEKGIVEPFIQIEDIQVVEILDSSVDTGVKESI
ncbi:MAG: hypothetical protein WCR55_14615 [Lentisphaerota bacterium]